jgi:hypothetical protein
MALCDQRSACAVEVDKISDEQKKRVKMPLLKPCPLIRPRSPRTQEQGGVHGSACHTSFTGTHKHIEINQTQI